MKVGDIFFLPRACHLLISNKVCDLRERIYERDIKNVNWKKSRDYEDFIFLWYAKKILRRMLRMRFVARMRNHNGAIRNTIITVCCNSGAFEAR